MNFNDKILDDWLKTSKLTLLDRLCLRQKRNIFTINIYNKNKYKLLTQTYFNYMPECNISNQNYDITFDTSGTSLINKLFNTYVDDNTLVISSNVEHPSVVTNLNKVKHKILLNIFEANINLDEIKLKLKQFNKVFIYIIGTHVINGHYTNQDLFLQLKKLTKNKQAIYVLDDVQGMFLRARDYSIFDYIVGTGHALIPNYDMGILINNKKYKALGKRYYYWGKKYIKLVKKLLNNKQTLLSFNNIMHQYYDNYINSNKYYEYNEDITAYYLFHINMKYTKLSQDKIKYIHKHYKIDLDDSQVIRMRAAFFLIYSNIFKSSISYINQLLEIYSRKDK